ncbi:MAG: AAA family ATPase, partial [Phycisphaerales bacterium]
MQLARLRLVNFRQHERTELDLGAGMIAIVGPNGSGKSTLLEAIAYALYGVPAARGTRDTLRRRGAPPRSRFEVELEFTLGRHAYRVLRTLTNAELFQDGLAIANSTGAVTERITALLGMSREEFFNTYFTGQKELAVMAAMTPAERGRFLSRVLGYERLREAQDRLRDRRNVRRSERQGIEQGLADEGEIATALSEAVAALAEARAGLEAAQEAERKAIAERVALAPTWDDLRERQQAWQGLDGQVRMAEARVTAARETFQRLDQEMARAVTASRRRDDLAMQLEPWERLAAEREVLDAAAALANARRDLLVQRNGRRDRLAAIASELPTLPDAATLEQAVAAERGAITALDAAARQLDERRTRWKQDEQEARTLLDQYRARYRELQEQHDAIRDAGEQGICPTCGRPLGGDVTETLALLARQMEEVRASGGYYRQRTEQLSATPPDVQEAEAAQRSAEQARREAGDQLATARAGATRRTALEDERRRVEADLANLEAQLSGPEASYDGARHEQVRQELSRLDPLRREHDGLAAVVARAEALGAEVTQAEQAKSAAEAQQAELRARCDELRWDEVEFRRVEAAVSAAGAAAIAATTARERGEERVAGAERLRELAVQRHADRAAKAALARTIAEELALLDELERAFGDLRTELVLQLRPELAERAAGFLQQLTRGRYADLELDEDYVATIVEDGEPKPVISGGEEDVVNLALRLAISQMIAERAGQPLSLLVLDEIFGSLDEERRES